MEWNISKGSGCCLSCKRGFQEEEFFFSALCLETDCLLRQDFCLECWKGRDPRGFFSFWKTRVPKKEEPRRRIVDNTVILNLFLRLQEVTEPWARNMQYVLGLFLLRRKLLKLVTSPDARDEGSRPTAEGQGGPTAEDQKGDFIHLYNPEEDRTYRIYNPNLTEEEIEKINNDVLRLLDPTAGQDISLPLGPTSGGPSLSLLDGSTTGV